MENAPRRTSITRTSKSRVVYILKSSSRRITKPITDPWDTVSPPRLNTNGGHGPVYCPRGSALAEYDATRGHSLTCNTTISHNQNYSTRDPTYLCPFLAHLTPRPEGPGEGIPYKPHYRPRPSVGLLSIRPVRRPLSLARPLADPTADSAQTHPPWSTILSAKHDCSKNMLSAEYTVMKNLSATNTEK